jgi:hypothetical protein
MTETFDLGRVPRRAFLNVYTQLYATDAFFAALGDRSRACYRGLASPVDRLGRSACQKGATGLATARSGGRLQAASVIDPSPTPAFPDTVPPENICESLL